MRNAYKERFCQMSAWKAERETEENIKLDLIEIRYEGVDNIKTCAIEFVLTTGCGRK